jgi:hypothetical protein
VPHDASKAQIASRSLGPSYDLHDNVCVVVPCQIARLITTFKARQSFLPEVGQLVGPLARARVSLGKVGTFWVAANT